MPFKFNLQRYSAGLFGAMAQLSRAKVSEKAMASLAAEACACLAAACKGEAQKDAREAVTAALAVWLGFLPGGFPKDTVEVAIAGLKDTKDGHHRSLLRMLVGALARNPGLAAGAAGLVKALAPLAKTVGFGSSLPGVRLVIHGVILACHPMNVF